MPERAAVGGRVRGAVRPAVASQTEEGREEEKHRVSCGKWRLWVRTADKTPGDSRERGGNCGVWQQSWDNQAC